MRHALSNLLAATAATIAWRPLPQRAGIALAAASMLLVPWPASTADQQLAAPPVATFSILGFAPTTGEVGGAVQSRVFSVGNGVLWAEAGIGAVATQAVVDVSYGPQALALLRKGIAPSEAIKRIWEADSDPLPKDWTKQGRQFAVINAK